MFTRALKKKLAKNLVRKNIELRTGILHLLVAFLKIYVTNKQEYDLTR